MHGLSGDGIYGPKTKAQLEALLHQNTKVAQELNLVGYYLLRHGKYNVKDIFDLNGQYGKINRVTCIAFLIAIIAEIPFINTSFYVGPIAKVIYVVTLNLTKNSQFPI